MKTLRQPETREQRGFFSSSSLRHVHIQESVWTSSSRMLLCKRIHLIPEPALGRVFDCASFYKPLFSAPVTLPSGFPCCAASACPEVWIFTLRSELSCPASFACFYFSSTHAEISPDFEEALRSQNCAVVMALSALVPDSVPVTVRWCWPLTAQNH